jgi:hypothetical protein
MNPDPGYPPPAETLGFAAKRFQRKQMTRDSSVGAPSKARRRWQRQPRGRRMPTSPPLSKRRSVVICRSLARRGGGNYLRATFVQPASKSAAGGEKIWRFCAEFCPIRRLRARIGPKFLGFCARFFQIAPNGKTRPKSTCQNQEWGVKWRYQL